MAKGTCGLSPDQYKRLMALAATYNKAAADLKDFLEELAGRWEVTERSERWLESDAGAEAQERLETVHSWWQEASDAGLDIDAEELVLP